jgi:hypothetical protein
MENEICKVHITYKMLRGEHEVAETCIDIPISEARYAELAQGVSPKNKAWGEIRAALVTVTRLQGYDALGSWSVDLEIKATEQTAQQELLKRCADCKWAYNGSTGIKQTETCFYWGRKQEAVYLNRVYPDTYTDCGHYEPRKEG